jgi:hypothetical protein
MMLTIEEARRLGQKYTTRRGCITDAMIARHLAGAITLAAPAAVDGRAHLPPLDIDAGGLRAIQVLIAEARQHVLWAFGQYCPGPSEVTPSNVGISGCPLLRPWIPAGFNSSVRS